MATMTAQPLEGPAAWRGADLARSTDWIWPISAAAAEELDAALRAVKRRGLAWRDIRREDFPIPGFARTLAEVQRELEDGRGVVLLRGPAGGGLYRGRAAAALLRHRRPPGLGALSELAGRADRRGARRGPGVRRGEPARHARPGRERSAHLALQGALERAAALPYRSHRRGGAPLRAPGPGGRAEQGGQLGGHSQRHPRAPPRSARAAPPGLSPEPRGRGGRAESGAPSRCRSGEFATDGSRASTRAPSSRPPSACPACRRSPRPRTRRSISLPRWRRSSATR